jgi:hypothetical protein
MLLLFIIYYSCRTDTYNYYVFIWFILIIIYLFISSIHFSIYWLFCLSIALFIDWLIDWLIDLFPAPVRQAGRAGSRLPPAPQCRWV